GVLANDVGSSLTHHQVVTPPAHGSLTLDADGSFSYAPDADFSGLDTFTYQAKDISGQVTGVATVTITVSPIATADSYALDAGTTLITTAGSGVLANDHGTSLAKNQPVA